MTGIRVIQNSRGNFEVYVTQKETAQFIVDNFKEHFDLNCQMVNAVFCYKVTLTPEAMSQLFTYFAFMD